MAGATSPALAAKRVVSNIPIVFSAVSGDPVNSGLVASLARPGGNATGTVLLGSDLDAKRLELLVQALPAPPRVALLRMPNSPRHDQGAREVENAARHLKTEIVRVEARSPDDIEQAMREARRRGANALLALGAPEYAAMRARIAEAALRHRLPAMTPEVGFGRPFAALEFLERRDPERGPGVEDPVHLARLHGKRTSEVPL